MMMSITADNNNLNITIYSRKLTDVYQSSNQLKLNTTISQKLGGRAKLGRSIFTTIN
jgi:hypothetical protein